MKVKMVSEAGSEFIPVRKSGDSGYDLRAAIDAPIELKPGERVMVPTGIRLEMEEGYEAQIRPRSGLAIKSGITVINTPGTVDASYRGICNVGVYNASQESFTINRGDRIAQLVFNRVEIPEIEIVETLSDTWRGEGGFGHTGIQ